MKNWLSIAGKLVNIIGSLSAFGMVIVGAFQKDYLFVGAGVLMAGYFKLDKINDGLDRATESVDLLVKMAAEARSRGG